MAFDITGQLNLRLASGAIRNIANEINTNLRSASISGMNVPVRADMATLRQIHDAFVSTGSAAEKFSQQSGLAFKRFAAFSAAAVPFIAVASGIRSAMTQAMEFDKEMVRLRQVTMDAGSEVGMIAQEVTRLSTNFGVSSADLMKTAVVLKQANLSIGETRDALEALAKSALAPNFDSIAQTTEGAIAVMNQFKIQGKELEQALGSMNAVAGEFAVEAGDLIEVVRRTGGAFKATGGDLNQLLALFTSVRQTTRESAESIATGLRTIFTRIQRNDTVNALKEFGVNLRFTREEAEKAGNLNLANQFIGGYEAIRRLSQALTQLPETDPRFSAIVEDLGGYRQISKVIPLIQEFAVSEKALMVAEAGRVSMTVNASQASESYANRLTKLQESYLALGRSLMDSSSFKMAFSSFEGLANSLLMVLNAARPLLPLLTAMATIKIGASIGDYFRGFTRSATSSPGQGVAHRANGGPIYMAKGGVVPGSGTGDTIPAMLEPGELVIPRRQAQKASFREKVIGRFMGAYNTEKGQGFANFYDQFRTKMDRLGAPGDAKRSFFERAYAYQSQGASDKLVIEVMGKVYNQYRDMARDGKQANADDFKPMLDSLGLNDKSRSRSKWFQQTLDGLAPTSRKKSDYYKGLTNPNFYPVDRNVIYTAYGVNAKEAKERGLLQVDDKKYQFFHSALAEAAKRMGTTGQRLQAAIFAARSKKNPDLAKTMAPLDKLVPYANGGIVPGVGNTDSVPALLPVGAFVLRKSSTNAMRKMADGGKVPAMVMPGEYIFPPEEAKQIGIERLQKFNLTGKPPAYASGGLVDPKLEATAQTLMDSGRSPNKNKDFREYLKQLEAAALTKGDLSGLTSFLPKVKGRGLLQYGNHRDSKDSAGYILNNKSADTAYVTKNHLQYTNSAGKVVQGDSVGTAIHEIAHLIDLQAGRVKSGGSNTSPSFLSRTGGTKTNDVIKKLEPLIHKAFQIQNPNSQDLKTQRYMSSPQEILARSFELSSFKNLNEKNAHPLSRVLQSRLSGSEYSDAMSHFTELDKTFRDEASSVLSQNTSGPTTPAPKPTPAPTTAAPKPNQTPAPTTPRPKPTQAPTTAAPKPTSAPTTPGPKPTTLAPTTIPPTTIPPTTRPPQNPRRAYERFKPGDDWRKTIRTAMATGNQVGPYATQMPELTGESSVRFLNDLGRTKGGRNQLRSQIEENLAKTNPNMSDAERNKISGKETSRILRTAKEASVFEKRLNEAENIRSQASSRGGDITQLSKLSGYINNLQKRQAFDPEAAAEIVRATASRNRIAQRVSQNENISLTDLNKVDSSGRYSFDKTTSTTLKDYRKQYAADATGAGLEAGAVRKQLEDRRQKLAGITVGMSQDPEGRLGFNFKGPDSAYGAQTRPAPNNNSDQTLGKILNNRAQDIFNIIDPTGKGKNLSNIQKEAIVNDQKIRLEREYVDSVRLQIQQHHKIKDAETARLIALQMYEQSLRTGASVVVDKKGVVLDKNMFDAGSTGKGQNRANVIESLKDGFKNAFSSQTGFFGLQMMSSYTAAGANALAGTAEGAAKNGNESGFLAARTTGGLLSGAATGAQLGMSFGPIGTAIGAAAGAAVGAATAFKNAADEINQAKLAIALRETSTALSNFAKGTYNLTPQNVEKFKKQQTTVDTQLSKKAAKDSSYLGFGFLYNQDRYLTELNKSSRETQAGQASPMMDALSTIVQDQAKLNLGNDSIKDRKSRESSFTDALFNQRGGLGGDLLGRTASATGQDVELLRRKMLDMFIRTQENELANRRKMTAETEVNKSSAAFGGLASAVEVATQRMTRMAASMKNMTDFMNGNVTAYSGTGLSESLQRPFGSDRGDFMSAVRAITKTGGAAGSEVEKSASAITEAGRLLPNIINAVRSQPVANLSSGTDLSVQIGDMLRNQMLGQGVDKTSASMVTNMVQSQLGAEDFSKMLRESGQDMGKLIQKILGPMSEPLKQSFSEIAKNLDERAKQFSDGLAELANHTRATGELIEKSNASQNNAVRNSLQTAVRRRLISEEGADNINLSMGLRSTQARQERLTGFGGFAAQSPDAIASVLGSVFDSIKKAETQIDAATKSGNIAEQNASILQLTSLKTRAADLGQALKNLTDVGERTAAAQEKLGKIQADKEGRQQLGLRYATANVEGRSEIARSFQLIQQAGRMGTAASFSVRDQNQIFSMLSSLSSQMRLQGLGGVTVKELTNQLMKNTFGAAFELDPQSAAMERALDNFVQQNYETAAHAAQMQVEIQQKLQGDFFSRLESNQSVFISELSRAMTENNRMLTLSMKMQAQTRLGDLEKKVGQASMLGKIGVTTDEEFKAVTNALNMRDSPIEKIFAAGASQNQSNKRTGAAIENSGRFADNLINAVGQTPSKNVGRSEALGTIIAEFSKLGFSDEGDRNKLLGVFSQELNKRTNGGALSENRNEIIEAIKEAVRNPEVNGVGQNEIEIQNARRSLEQGEMIPKGIIDKIVSSARVDGGDLTISSMKEAASSVSQTNKSFSELNKALEEARRQVQGFVIDLVDQPAVGLVGRAEGGPIKFFNKGGWGSGGSLNSHDSDTVNARISPNEFVVSAGPAQKNRKFLERINAGYAEGGEVDPNKKIIEEFSKTDAGNILNPKAYLEAIAQAKKIDRLNAQNLFFSQLKGMKPDDRSKFIFDQSEKLKTIAGKENNEQLGTKEAIEKILAANNKVESNYSTSKLSNYYDASQTAAIGLSLKNAPFELEKQIGHLQKIGEYSEMLINRVDPRLQQMSDVDTDFKAKNKFSLTDTIRQTPRLKSHEWITDPNALSQKIDQNLLRYEFGSLKEERLKKGVPASIRQMFSAFFDNGELSHPRALVDLDILHKRYGGDPKSLRTEAITEHLDKWYQDTKSSRALNQTKASDFVGDVKGHLGGKDQNIDKIIDDAIKSMLDEKEKIKQVESTKGGIKKVSSQRSSAFQTPAQGISNILSDRGDKKFGREQDAKLMQLQLMSIEADAFNKLNPAIQSKLLEQKRQKIEDGKLSPTEKGQMVQSGLWDAISSTKDITAEEIKGFAENRSKMTLVQRAALEILMTRALAGSKEKIDKDPDSLSAAEKAAYLISLDSQGRKEAFEAFNDRNNVVLFTRIGQSISNNPGSIQALLSKAQENGPAAYAKEAALLEMIAASFGAPTTLPKASEAYKDKSLKSKAVPKAAIPAPQAKVPEVAVANGRADVAKDQAASGKFLNNFAADINQKAESGRIGIAKDQAASGRSLNNFVADAVEQNQKPPAAQPSVRANNFAAETKLPAYFAGQARPSGESRKAPNYFVPVEKQVNQINQTREIKETDKDRYPWLPGYKFPDDDSRRESLRSSTSYLVGKNKVYDDFVKQGVIKDEPNIDDKEKYFRAFVAHFHTAKRDKHGVPDGFDSKFANLPFFNSMGVFNQDRQKNSEIASGFASQIGMSNSGPAGAAITTGMLLKTEIERGEFKKSDKPDLPAKTQPDTYPWFKGYSEENLDHKKDSILKQNHYLIGMNKVYDDFVTKGTIVDEPKIDNKEKLFRAFVAHYYRGGEFPGTYQAALGFKDGLGVSDPERRLFSDTALATSALNSGPAGAATAATIFNEQRKNRLQNTRIDRDASDTGSNLGLSAGALNSGPAGAAINAAVLEEQNNRTRSKLDRFDVPGFNNDAKSPADVTKPTGKLTYPWLPNYFGPEITPETEKEIAEPPSAKSAYSSVELRQLYDMKVRDGKLIYEKDIDEKTKQKRFFIEEYVDDLKKNEENFEKNKNTAAATNSESTYSWKPDYFGPKVLDSLLNSTIKSSGYTDEYIESMYDENIKSKNFNDEKDIDIKNKEIRNFIQFYIEKDKKAKSFFKKADGGLIKFASGGLVPGVGNTDSVRANLPVGSYVIKKSSVQKFGADNLSALPHLAKGGVVPAMVMPGEHIFTPNEASKIGKSNLDTINQKGSLLGYDQGGIVVNGIRYMPAGTEKWGQRNTNSLGFQPQTIKDNGNPLASKNNTSQGMTEGQFLAIESINQNIGDSGSITALKAKFFSLRNSMRDPRQRTKENIVQLRQMYSTLTNPMVVQMDAQRQMMGAQEAFASFQQDPKAFIAKSKELRALAANAKATMEERVAAKEQLNQMSHAARFIDPRALTAAASAAQKQKQQQQKAGGDQLQGGLLRLDPTLAANKMAPAPNGVEAHNARVRASAQGQEAPDRKAAEASHLKKMLEIAQENYFKTGDPKFLQEINKIKNPDKVRAEEKSVAQTTMDDHRAKKQQEAEENKIGQWHVREGIEDIRDPGGVKRSAEKLQRFYAEKNKNREEFESRVFARAPTYEENIPKMQKEWDEKNKGAYEARMEQLQKEGEERLNMNPRYRAMTRQLAESPYNKNQIVKKASGGIVPGYGSGDHVPALLEPGEAVIPRKAVQKFANGGIVGGIQGFANGGMAQGGGPELLDVAAKFNQAATQISQGLSGFSTSVSTFNGAVASFGTFVDKFDEAVGKIPGQIELSGANEISVNLMGQDSIVKAVTEAIGPMIAEAIRANQPVEQRSQ